MKVGDYFKLDNIRNFIEGKWNKFRAGQMSGFLSLEEHVKEQALWRAILCSDCYKAGKCIVCGCQTPDMFYAPKKQCPKDKWGAVLSKEEWIKYKADNDMGEINGNIDLEKLMRDEMEGLPEWLKNRMIEMEEEKLRKRTNTEPFVK